MASIQRHGNRYRAQVSVKGERASAMFDTRKDAAQWALEREAEMRGRKLPDKTFGDAMLRYSREISEERVGGHWERIRLRAMMRVPIARRRMEALAGSDFATWHDGRLSDAATAARQPTAAAIDAEAERRVAVVARHRTEWEQVAALRREALQVREDDPADAFQRAKLAKITAEMTAIQQAGERKAWGLDAAETAPNQGVIVVNLRRAPEAQS